jgi:lysine-N-methylase
MRMKEVHDYLMPEYFPEFACKMGECRAACCVGWPITFSVDDFFRLTSSECSPELRRRMDRGIRLELAPTPERYAQIAPRYDGQCPMRLSDGRCAVHAELGEDKLATVCRLYPRGIRAQGGYECSCANSCEAVLELMFKRDAPLRFITRKMSFDIPNVPMRTVFFDTMGHEQRIRLWLIGIIQERTLPLPQRIILLGLALERLEQVLNDKDEGRLTALIGQRWQVTLPAFDITQRHLEFGLDKARALVALLDARSDGLRQYGQEALDYFEQGERPLEKYMVARIRFENSLPKWEIWFEHVLVNHMFFEQFPFQDRPDSMWDEFVAISAVYALLRFLSIGYLAQRECETGLVDMVASAFRLIDHTSFDRYAARALRDMGCAAPQDVFDVIVM